MLEIDDISPAYIREQRITLVLDESTAKPKARQPVLVNFDYSKVGSDGLVMPLIFEVTGPSEESAQRREFSIQEPEFVAWTPREGGRHMLILRELGHNLWWGSLEVDVEGDPIGDTD